MLPLIWLIGLIIFVGVIWFVVSLFSPNILLDIAAAVVAAIIWIAGIGTPVSTAIASGLPNPAPPQLVCDPGWHREGNTCVKNADTGTAPRDGGSSGETAKKAPPTGSGSNSGTGFRVPNDGLTTPYEPSNTQPDPVQARWKHITGKADGGVSNVWGGAQLDLTPLAALKDGEMYVAHGDVGGTGSCQVWYWLDTKPTRSQLSAATWQLYHVQGASPEALMDAVAVKQLIAGKGDIPTCPATQKG